VTQAADDFDRADGSPGSNWSVATGTWAIASNRLECVQTSAAQYIFWAAAAATDAQFVEFDWSSTDSSWDATLALNSPGTYTSGFWSNGYNAWMSDVTNGGFRFFKNGTELGAEGDSGVSVTSGIHRLRFENDGTGILKAYVDDTLAKTFDDSASPLTSKMFGLGFATSNSTPSRVNNFEGGDLVEPPAPQLRGITRSGMRVG
jgi:hypothetical protein